MSKPILLLGESPNRATVGRPHLWLLPDSSGKPHSANRLLGYTGWSTSEYLSLVGRDNLLHHHPGGSGKGANWDAAGARERVPVVLDSLFKKKQILLILGWRVAMSFNWYNDVFHRVCKSKLSYLYWEYVGEKGKVMVPTAVVPHPSGINQWWNSKENRDQALRFFSTLRRRFTP